MDLFKRVDGIKRVISRKGIRYFEVFMKERRENFYEIKASQVETAKHSDLIGVGIRVWENGALGFAYTFSDSDEYIDEAAEKALNGARYLKGDKYLPPALTAFHYPSISGLDTGFSTLSTKEKIGKAILAENASLNYDRRIRKKGRCFYGDSFEDVILFNHEDVLLHYSRAYFTLSVMAVAEDGPDAEEGWEMEGSRRFDQIDAERVGRDAAKKALALLGGKGMESREAPVLLRGDVASDFLRIIAQALSAEDICKGRSMLAGKIGERTFSPILNIIDDGLLFDGINTSPFDDEGVPRRRNEVVSNGIIKTYLCDTCWGGRISHPSTGNAMRASIKVPPSPGPSNFFILPGSSQPEEIINKMDRGLMILQTLGSHTIDPVTGDFSLGVSGIWIEHGDEKGAVRGVTISGNVFEIFGKIEEIGSDLKFYGPFGSPSLLISSVIIGGV